MLLSRITLGLAVVFCAAPLLAADKPDPREEPQTAVAEAIRLLDAKEYAKFIRAFMPPDELEKTIARKPFDEFVEEFGRNKAERANMMLKSIVAVKPTMSEDGTKAKFEAPEDAGEGKKKPITFVKVGKYWYISN